MLCPFTNSIAHHVTRHLKNCLRHIEPQQLARVVSNQPKKSCPFLRHPAALVQPLPTPALAEGHEP